jgi:hypothetical protein
MRRRVFLSLSLFSTLSLKADKREDKWLLLESVQNDLFPDSSKFEAIRYLKIVSSHSSFNGGDLRFIFDGLGRVQKLGYKSNLSSAKRQSILNEFEKSSFGHNWISTILKYILEALFGDPIYGGNKNEFGWKSYNHNEGFPRPKKRFLNV